jgi:Tfp pilus assembly protein PilF
MRIASLAIAAFVAIPTAVAAQSADLEYPAGALGTDALVSGDYARAERQIRESDISKYDPARALNLGLVFAKTGRTDRAVKEFRRVLLEDNVELELADGKTIRSHDAARQALAQVSSPQ